MKTGFKGERMTFKLSVLLSLALCLWVACSEVDGKDPLSGGGAGGGTWPGTGGASGNGGAGNAMAAGVSGGFSTGGTAPVGCTPGETQTCGCADGTTGFSTCNASGTAFDPCECSSDGLGGSGGSGGTGGTGGSAAGVDGDTGGVGGTAGDGGTGGSDAGGTTGSETDKLHVSGAFLQDTSNKNVLLHGWMQPTASWFNGEGNRYSDPTDWNEPANVAGLLNFMKAAATVMSDPSPKYGRSHGWYATFVRVNTDSVGGWTSEQGLVDSGQFDGWINNFLVPYVDHLRSRGLYLVLSATGPMVVNVGGDSSRNMGQGTQQRMIAFWEAVANAPGIKSVDNVMFELMNEPVAIETSFGANDWGFGSAPFWQALKNWMQPVVDTVRNTGADNVIWLPTLGWQGEPMGWAEYPISGSNIGVAAHYYPAYGGVHDDATAVQNLWNSNYKPAADLWPMMITEMMWIPNPPGGYDDLFNGTTAGFGNAVKNAIDNQGNVSFLVGFLADHLVDLRTTPPAGCTLGSHEGSQAYFEWLPTYTSAAPTGHPFL